jgi:hypothetical protein
MNADLSLNSIDRYRKRSNRLILEEHRSCELPAGCGGVVLRWGRVGIPLKFESPGWTEFVTEGATLALHNSDASARDREIHAAQRAGQCRAGFQVPNLDEFDKRMTEHNVPCVQEPT